MSDERMYPNSMYNRHEDKSGLPPPDDCDHDWKCVGTYDRDPPTYIMKCTVCDKKENFSQKGLKLYQDSKHPAMKAVKRLELRVAELERKLQELQDKNK